MSADKSITPWQEFETELDDRSQSIFSMLPSNISPQKFRNTAIAAVKKNPDLLKCTLRTLFSSITAAALDGLMPDGKEGIIQDRNVKVSKRNEADRWEVQATWQPMFHGFRKRARELDGLLVDAQVVHKNDLFKRIQGDEPRLMHEPAPPDEDPGPMVAAYAIFKREDGTILHREVMRRSEIEDTQKQSKQPDGLMWRVFTTEAWKKTVGRRGFKSVPVSEGMAEILDRDDKSNFEFERHVEAPKPVLTPPPAPKRASTPALEDKPGVTLDATSTKGADPVPVSGSAAQEDAQHAQPAKAETHDPDTGETGPRPLPVSVEKGKEQWVPWGKAFIAAIMASFTYEEVAAWRSRNEIILERCEKSAPKAYASIQKAITQKAEELHTVSAKSAEGETETRSDPAEEVGADQAYKDWVADAFAELSECKTEAAVEDLRDRVLAELKVEDIGPWKEAAADKATSLFNGK